MGGANRAWEGGIEPSVDAARLRAYSNGSRDPIFGVLSFGSALAP